MVTRFPGRWRLRTSRYSGNSVEQAVAQSSVLAVLKGRAVRSIDFVEFTGDGGARLIVEFGSRR